MAVLDVGTNTVLYLRAAWGGRDFVALEEDAAPTRLGEGLSAGEPSAVAQERTLAAVAAFVERAGDAGAAEIKIVGTEVLRRGGWRRAFTAAVRARLGLEVTVLSPEEEGALALLAARRSLPLGLTPVIVADVGGGSAQITREAGRGRPPAVASLAIGCVVVTEKYLTDGTPAAWEKATRYVRKQLERVAAARPGTKAVLAGGAAAALPALEQKLRTYDPTRVHGFAVTRELAAAWAARVYALPQAKRDALPGMPAGRGDVFAAGALALAEIMARLGCDRGVVTTRGVRWGVAYRWFDETANA